MISLPHPSTTFVGRTDELRDITARLADPACQLLTLVGPGGIGKTYLALQAGHRITLPNGVYFVPLQPLTSSDFIVSAITEALGLHYGDAPHEKLLNYLQDKSLLLVLDNFEHLLDGVSLLGELLSQAPGLKLLVTSRERLNSRYEWIVEVAGLNVPLNSHAAGIEAYSAVQLFVQSARRIKPDFSLSDEIEAVVRICKLLEGMPLALELASSWVSVLTCREIVQELERGLDILETSARDVPERHLSMRAVLHHSWNLLPENEQQVFRKLSIFRGGFTREAAHEVTGASLNNLKRLIDKSWLRHEATGRYDLHELLRQYAADQLSEAGEAEATTERHLTYFLALAQGAENHVFGREQIAWFDQLETEIDNLRAALTWSLRDGKARTGLDLAAALGWFFSERSHMKEGLEWFAHLSAADPDAPASLRAKVLHSTASLLGLLNYYDEAAACCEQALVLAREADDTRNIAWALSHKGFYKRWGFPYDQRVAALEESVALFRKLEDKFGLCHTLFRRASKAYAQDDFDTARERLVETAVLAQEAGDKVMTGWGSYLLGEIASRNRDFEQANRYYEKSLAVFLDARFMIGAGDSLSGLAAIARESRNDAQARAIYEKALTLLRERAPDLATIDGSLDGIAVLARSEGQFKRAAILFAAVSHNIHKHPPGIPAFEENVAAVRAELSEPAFAEAWAVGLTLSRDQIIAYALESRSASSNPSSPSKQPLSNLLTHRELEILRFVADGLSNGEIAQQLHFTVSTVKWYLSEIYSKLGVHGRAKAVAYAREQGLLA